MQIHLQRSDLLKQKGRLEPSLLHMPLLPQQEKERLNECLSEILIKKGKEPNETT